MDPIIEIIKICTASEYNTLKHDCQLCQFVSCLSNDLAQQLYEGIFELACRINPYKLSDNISRIRDIFCFHIRKQYIKEHDDKMIWFLQMVSLLCPTKTVSPAIILRMKKYLLLMNDEKYSPKLSYLYSHCITFIPDTNIETQEEFLKIYNYIFAECIDNRRICPLTNGKDLSEFITEFHLSIILLLEMYSISLVKQYTELGSHRSCKKIIHYMIVIVT